MWKSEYGSRLYMAVSEPAELVAARRIKNQHSPKKLYKYRAVDRFSIENLEADTVWVADPKSFNDPYDCLSLMIHGAMKQFNSAQEGFLEEYLREKNEIRVGVFKFVIDNKAVDFSEIFYQEIYNNIVESKNNWIASVCCFAEAVDSMLLWSHYADNHRGFCIEYEGVVDENYLDRHLYPILYTEKIPNIGNIIDAKFLSTELFSILGSTVKSIEWSYEKE